MELLVIPSTHDLQFESSQLQIDYQKINDEQGVIDNWRRKDRQIFVSKMLKLIYAVVTLINYYVISVMMLLFDESYVNT